MKEIPLTKGKVALVDDDDWAAVSQYHWQAVQPAGRAWYAMRAVSTAAGKQAHVYMHRELLGALPGQEVDHIDHNGLNNTRANIRLCTRAQNTWHTAKSTRRGGSQFKGVYPVCPGCWRASITVNGQEYRLGYFSSEMDAASAYDTACRSHHGAFAVPNLPQIVLSADDVAARQVSLKTYKPRPSWYQRKSSRASSAYRGVVWVKESRSWEASVHYRGQK